ncbi:unnamed protein product [Linum trigynum]|uniref:Uncharacterized protein n=1 Tax=Linum trigynum TaxID=586398 RepID=A0AAV2ETG7_9ROSI
MLRMIGGLTVLVIYPTIGVLVCLMSVSGADKEGMLGLDDLVEAGEEEDKLRGLKVCSSPRAARSLRATLIKLGHDLAIRFEWRRAPGHDAALMSLMIAK